MEIGNECACVCMCVCAARTLARNSIPYERYLVLNMRQPIEFHLKNAHAKYKILLICKQRMSQLLKKKQTNNI